MTFPTGGARNVSMDFRSDIRLVFKRSRSTSDACSLVSIAYRLRGSTGAAEGDLTSRKGSLGWRAYRNGAGVGGGIGMFLLREGSVAER